jgi:hypothetical protein
MTAERKRRCFVISPIGPEGSTVREHADDIFEFIIRPALDACQIEAFRSDHLREPGKISDQMFRSILTDDLCVAVLTGNNPNVYYELAVAQAAARPVIILIEKGQSLPFDIQDLRCVWYDLKIRSFHERTYINEVIAHVQRIESAGWTMPPPFGVLPPLGGRRSGAEEARFFEKAMDHGQVDVWLPDLEKTSKVLDLMGTSLDYWRSSRAVNDLLASKARAGCQVRILLMHPDNPVLKLMIHDAEGDLNYQAKVKDVEVMERHFAQLARRTENIAVRTMRRGCPHLSITRTDQMASLVLHLFSEKLRYCPMWIFPHGSRVYNVLAQEFETLWQLNAGPS